MTSRADQRLETAVRDPERLRAVHSTGLLDTGPDPDFDRWTAFVRRVLGADISLMTLIDGSRQFFKSAAGLDEPWSSERETPLTHSFCKHVVARGAMLRPEAAPEHPSLADNRAIDDLEVIAYLGVPLRGRDGRILGALSAIQSSPRDWTAEQAETLSDAARAVESQIALQTLQRRSDAVLADLTDLVWIVDVDDGRIRYRSPSTAELFGDGRSDPGRSLSQLVYSDDRHELDAALRRVRSRPGTPLDVSLRVLPEHGRHRSVDAKLTDRSEDPAIGGVLVVASDVTDRRLAETKLSMFLQHAPVGLWMTDEKLSVTWTAGSTLVDLGMGDRDLVGKSIFELLGSDDPEHPPIAAYHETLAGRPSRFDIEWGGRTWAVRLSPLAVDGPVTGVVGVGLDVTEHRETERRLADRTVHLQRLFDEAPEAIILVDQEDRILQVNPEFERLFGYTADEAEGRFINELIVPAGAESEASNLTRRVTEGERVEVEAKRRRKDGSTIDVSILATPVQVGDQPRVYGIYRDITERKELEVQLLHSQRLEAVGQLAGGVAHDFNNLLTAILGNVQILLAQIEDEAIREDLDEIAEAGARGARLTRQLLTFSRRDLASPEPLCMTDVVLNVRGLLERLIEERVELAFELHGDLPTVVIDSGQLEQVILNLVLNARDAMPGGGRVTVRTSRRSIEGPLGVPEREFVVLSVRDGGSGMSQEERARMFEPFFTTKPPGQGTGLGLSTVYGIVERCAGFIEVESSPEAGTLIEVHLPAAPAGDEAPAAPASPDREAIDGASGELVLLVDDDPAVRTVTRKILQHAGYDVLEAGSGNAALALCDRSGRAPAAVVSDVVMPGLSGYELVDELRARYPDVAILLMTGYTEPDQDDSADRGELITKPFDAMTLVRRLRERLAGPGMERLR